MKQDFIKLLSKVSIALTGVDDVNGLLGAILLAPCLIIWWLLLYAIS